MNDFRLVLDHIDFAELVEFGRSMIPTYAPEWTDHNYHDPGIMLIELLAFVADAQIYALSRTRCDERQAYGRLVGVEPHGPQPATGLIWPSETTVATPLWLVMSVCTVTFAFEPRSDVVAAYVPHSATCTGLATVSQTWR